MSDDLQAVLDDWLAGVMVVVDQDVLFDFGRHVAMFLRS